jgi:DNA/RNA-binding domain of Phe-tRNA-synthetase-like protein
MREMFETSEDWNRTYPGAAVGVLVMGDVNNPQSHPELERRKMELEENLRAKYASYDRAALNAEPILGAYRAYYKKFKKTYHVQHQLESVVHKGKSIPRVAALVEAMFMAELKNMLLTAGHDMDHVIPPVRVDIAKGDENFIRMNGIAQNTKPKDMLIVDSEGILSCILYGPAQRAQIRPETKRALFTVYAPAGISKASVQSHLEVIRENVSIISPDAVVETLEVFLAGFE